jgi:hypothetical protein
MLSLLDRLCFCLPAFAPSTSPFTLGYSKLLGSLFCFSLILLAPCVRAESPNGTYKLVSISGQIRLFGEPIRIDRTDAEDFGLANDGEVRIQDGKLHIVTSQLKDALRDLEDELEVTMKIRVSGPKTIAFKKNGTGWSGKSTSPSKTTFSYRYRGRKINGQLSYLYDIKINSSGVMTGVTSITGAFFGIGGVSGKVTTVFDKND